MAKPLTKCPKCSAKITNRFECRNCGLIFDRYFKAETRKKKEAKARAAQRTRTRQILNTSLAAAVAIVIIGGGYFYLKNRNKNPVTPLQETTITQEIISPAETPAPSTEQPPETKTSAPIAGNAIDIARNATVTIHAPWGQGTGFFIKEDKLLTNRHVVSYDEARLKNEELIFKEKQVVLDAEKEKILKAKEQAQTISDTQEKTAFEADIEKREKHLEWLLNQHQQKQEEISTMRQELKTPDIYILLHDGRKVHMAFMESSSNHDLALLTVFNTQITPAHVADRQLSEEANVFSLGINKTSYNGIFAGYNDQGYIMTDRRIKTSYSGGPLIDDKGMVHGISVLPPPDQRDLGLAVPIDIAMREFGL